VSERRYFAGTDQTIEIVLDAAATGGELGVMTLRLPPGAGSPPHRHNKESETFVVREGELEVDLEGEAQTIMPGEAIFLPRGALHSFVSPAGALVAVLIVPAGLEEFFRATCPTEPDGPLPDEGTVAAALERHGLDFSGA